MRIEGVALAPAAVSEAWGQEQEVAVHLVKEELAPLTVLIEAKRTATRIYAGIGVKLKWSGSGKEELSIQFETGQPSGLHPGALGYAMPFAQSGTCIHVLIDRLDLSVTKPLRAALLGHVIAHELAHVLEGFPRHAEAGVMKARWDNHDLEQMLVEPLSFSAEDAMSIRLGVARVMERSKENPIRTTFPATRTAAGRGGLAGSMSVEPFVFRPRCDMNMYLRLL
jgi:hypothetical protein